jgi:hypothetical protein
VRKDTNRHPLRKPCIRDRSKILSSQVCILLVVVLLPKSVSSWVEAYSTKAGCSFQSGRMANRLPGINREAALTAHGVEKRPTSRSLQRCQRSLILVEHGEPLSHDSLEGARHVVEERQGAVCILPQAYLS